MLAPVEDDVLVHLVAQKKQIPAVDHGAQRVDVVFAPHRSRGVVRCVDDDQPGPIGQVVRHPVPIDPVIGRVQRNVTGNAALKLHHRRVAIIGGVENDHLVARVHHGRYRAEQRFGGARGDGQLPLGIQLTTVKLRDLARRCLAKRRDPRHRRVLVVAVGQVVLNPFQQLGRAVEIGKTLG